MVAPFTLDGKRVTHTPRADYFNAVKGLLGNDRTEDVRTELNRLIDAIPPNKDSGKRTFSSSHLGSSLTPWLYPLAHLYDAALEMEGKSGTEDHIQEQAGFSFGLFVWECIVGRDERWTFYDPNLPGDPNKEITGKVYFEQ